MTTDTETKRLEEIRSMAVLVDEDIDFLLSIIDKQAAQLKEAKEALEYADRALLEYLIREYVPSINCVEQHGVCAFWVDETKECPCTQILKINERLKNVPS